jgi:hypothetical protein
MKQSLRPSGFAPAFGRVVSRFAAGLDAGLKPRSNPKGGTATARATTTAKAKAKATATAKAKAKANTGVLRYAQNYIEV